ncbi:sn-1-specific diacylglycerol lipase ABHD11 [Parasteatoda tepidariorum]|uniref:sn-1-specific diacylglycerol lipase ABHD11 n=1 Tax=Parasteatoda tepidariorum TaxID=114398 RepID=UPI00077FDD42|nr:protein ABHD11 [Parasteatoda tepidariorum]XP_042899866.1 protein ABHD11 [Parasteatoda tepidariorum]
MMLHQNALFLALFLGLSCIIFSKQTEVNCPEQPHSEDSCPSSNTPEPLPLAYTCMSITYNGKTDDRAPILILHGFTWFKEMYMDIAKYLALKTARKVYAADLRNHGDSPWSEEADSKAMASDLALFMKTIEADKIVLVGHSMGGKVAVEFALTYPEKVEKIVVEDMRPNGMSEEGQQTFDPNQDWSEFLRKPLPDGLTEYEAKKYIIKYFERTFEQMNETIKYDDNFMDFNPIKCSEGKCSWKSNMNVLRKIFANPSKFWPDSSGKFEKPALFIHGELSIFKIGDVKEEIVELFPDAKLVEVKGKGHILNPYIEYRKEVVDFINAKD